jgi:hypothetical protein
VRKTIFLLAWLLLVIPCKVQAACEPNIPGDVSGDCKVDFNDFAIIASDWLESSSGEPNQEWLARYNGSGNYFDDAFAIAIDSNDNIYVTGHSAVSGSINDYATVKYDPNGNEVWVATYDGPGNYFDYAEAIAIDSNDNIYVTGESLGSGTDPEP